MEWAALLVWLTRTGRLPPLASLKRMERPTRLVGLSLVVLACCLVLLSRQVAACTRLRFLQ